MKGRNSNQFEKKVIKFIYCVSKKYCYCYRWIEWTHIGKFSWYTIFKCPCKQLFFKAVIAISNSEFRLPILLHHFLARERMYVQNWLIIRKCTLKKKILKKIPKLRLSKCTHYVRSNQNKKRKNNSHHAVTLQREK